MVIIMFMIVIKEEEKGTWRCQCLGAVRDGQAEAEGAVPVRAEYPAEHRQGHFGPGPTDQGDQHKHRSGTAAAR